MPTISTMVTYLFPGVEEGGVCRGLTKMAIRALLCEKIEDLVSRGGVIANGVCHAGGARVTVSDLQKLLSSLEKECQRLKIKEDAIVAEESAEPDYKTPPSDNYLAPQPARNLPLKLEFEKLAAQQKMTDFVLTEEQKKTLEQLTDPEEKTKAAPIISASELKQQMNLAWKIRHALLKIVRFEKEKYKNYDKEHPYIATLNELEVFLTGVALQQQPEAFQMLPDVRVRHRLPQKFQSLFVEPPTQLINPLDQWLDPVMLDSKDEKQGQTTTINFSRKHTPATLQAAFNGLDEELQKYVKNAKTALPFALQVAVMGHTFVVGYNPQNKWFIIDLFNPSAALARDVKQENIGREVCKALSVALPEFTITGREMEFVIGYLAASKKYVLLKAKKAPNSNGSLGVEKRILALLQSKKLLLLDDLAQNIVFNASVSDKLQNLVPFLKSWKQSQKISLDNKDDLPLLHFHCSKGVDVTEIDELVKAGADVNQLDQYNKSPLAYACSVNNYVVAEHLIKKHKANPNLGDPINLAAKEGYDKLVSLLIDAKASPIDSGVTIATALHHKHEPVVRRLIAAKFNLDSALKYLRNHDLEEEAVNLQANRFRHYISALTGEMEDKKIFSALHQMLDRSPEQVNFFGKSANSWAYLSQYEMEASIVSAYANGKFNVVKLEQVLTQKPDWIAFWKEVEAQYPTKDIQQMQEKILSSLRYQLMQQTIPSKDDFRQNEQLINLRRGGFLSQEICKWLEYRMKHVPFVYKKKLTASEMSLQVMLRPHTETALFEFIAELERINKEESEVKKPRGGFFGSSASKESFVGCLMQDLNKLLEPGVDAKQEHSYPTKTTDEVMANLALNFLQNEISKQPRGLAAQNALQTLRDFHQFTKMGLCTACEAVSGVLTELKYAENTSDELKKIGKKVRQYLKNPEKNPLPKVLAHATNQPRG